jgi:O-antigen/teichoic acid export membrane protein
MSARSVPSLTNQAFFLILARIAGFIISLALPMLLARAMSQREYGLFKQSFLVITTFVGILPLGVGMSAFYYLAREEARHRSAIINIVVFHTLAGFVPFILLLLFPGLLGLAFRDGHEVVASAPMIGLIVLVTMVSSLLETVATAYQDVRWSTVFLVGAQLSKAIFMLSATLINPSLNNLLRAALFHALVEGAVLIWYLNKIFPQYWKAFDLSFFREQLSYALPLGAAGLLYIMQTELPNYFVSWQFGAAAFATYANGNFQVPLLGLIRDSMSSVLLSRTSGLQQTGDREEILQLNQRVTRKLMLIYFPAFALLQICGRELIVFFYGANYASSWPIFRINLFLLLFNVFINDPVLRAFAQYRYYLVILRCIIFVLLLPALFLLSRANGLEGAMAAVVGLAIAERIILLAWVNRILGATRRDYAEMARVAAPIALASAMGALAAWGVRMATPNLPPIQSLAVAGTVFALANLGATLALRILNQDEIDLIRRQMVRFDPRLRSH